MQTATTCTSCGGTGRTLLNKPSGADANGMIKKEETVPVKIPSGVEEGMQLKVSGKGNEHLQMAFLEIFWLLLKN
jgi:molecular chaperone DnaJ